MPPITITFKENGPYRIAPEDAIHVQLVDYLGNVVPLPESPKGVALCRCGASTRKPFCDGTHSKIGFQGARAAAEAADAEQRSGEAPPGV